MKAEAMKGIEKRRHCGEQHTAIACREQKYRQCRNEPARIARAGEREIADIDDVRTRDVLLQMRVHDLFRRCVEIVFGIERPHQSIAKPTTPRRHCSVSNPSRWG